MLATCPEPVRKGNTGPSWGRHRGKHRQVYRGEVVTALPIERIAELERLAKAATPGPFGIERRDDDCGYMNYIVHGGKGDFAWCRDELETGPITFERHSGTWRLVTLDVDVASDPARWATPADLAAAGWTSNTECARVLGDLQQAHLRELAEARAEVESAKAKADEDVNELRRMFDQQRDQERAFYFDQLAAERAKRELLEEKLSRFVAFDALPEDSAKLADVRAAIEKAGLNPSEGRWSPNECWGILHAAFGDQQSSPAQPVESGKLGEHCLADMEFERDGVVVGADVCRLQRGHAGSHRSALLPRSQPTPTGEGKEVVEAFVAERKEQLSQAYDSPLTQEANGYAPSPVATAAEVGQCSWVWSVGGHRCLLAAGHDGPHHPTSTVWRPDEVVNPYADPSPPAEEAPLTRAELVKALRKVVETEPETGWYAAQVLADELAKGGGEPQ